MWASAPDRGTLFSCREYQGLRGDPQCFGRGSPGCIIKTTDECDSGCNFSCHFFNVLLEVQHPVQEHAKVLWSLLKHQAFVVDKHVQFPLSFSVIEMVGGRNCLAYAKLKTSFPKVVNQDSHVVVETLFRFLPRGWPGRQHNRTSLKLFPEDR